MLQEMHGRLVDAGEQRKGKKVPWRKFLFESVEKGGDKEWRNTWEIGAFGDQCKDVGDLATGAEMDITVTIKPREWEAPDGTVKYFVDVSLFKIEHVYPKAESNDAPF